MRENIDHTFAKSRDLVWKVTGDMVILIETSSRVILNDQSIDLLAISRKLFGTSLKSSDVFGNRRTSSDMIGPLRKILTLSG